MKEKFNTSTSPYLRVVGVKIISDGVVDSCTAALSDPYWNGVQAVPIWDSEQLKVVASRADEAGLQIVIHASGDAAVTQAVDALESLGTSGKRHRIEHLELTKPRDAKRLGELGITASFQPVHADPYNIEAWPQIIGPHRCERAFAWKDFSDGDPPIAISTDAPTARYSAFDNL